MKEHGFTDEVTQKAEEKKRLNWGGATIKDLNLLGAVTVPHTVKNITIVLIFYFVIKRQHVKNAWKSSNLNPSTNFP